MNSRFRIENDQYGGIYRGIVIANTDPENRGRCKVFIPTIYPIEFADGYDITQQTTTEGTYGKRLPWAEPSQPLFGGGFGENGMTQYPDIGTHVWIMFESGDIHRPIMMGVIQHNKAKFENDKCILKYGNMTITLDKSTDTITLNAKNIVTESEQYNNTALIHNCSAGVYNCVGTTGDCEIDGVSLLNHVHIEMQAGDVVSAGSVKTKSAKASI